MAAAPPHPRQQPTRDEDNVLGWEEAEGDGRLGTTRRAVFSVRGVGGLVRARDWGEVWIGKIYHYGRVVTCLFVNGVPLFYFSGRQL